MTADGSKLRALMDQDELRPIQERQIEGAPQAIKDEVTKAVRAQAAPSGRVLGRLMLIVGPSNQADVEAAFLANVSAAAFDARHASIAGLWKLGHAKAKDLAMVAASDRNDQVAVLACDLLLQKRKDPGVEDKLGEVLALRQGDQKFDFTVRLLEAAGVKPAPIVVAVADGGSDAG